jgi:methionine-S-sulfoxide reductase
MSEATETAILAGGCFWPAQELLRHRVGVISTRVGYTGGNNDNPTADNHPGHAEAVEVIFDPGRTSYREILEFFFQIHRPDLDEGLVGSDYRSEIFYTSDEQRRVAEHTVADADASGLWPLARQGRDQDQQGRSFLGGRGPRPGLPRALPRRQESVRSVAGPAGGPSWMTWVRPDPDRGFPAPREDASHR